MPLYDDIKKIEAEVEYIEAQVMEFWLLLSHRSGSDLPVAALYVKEGNNVVSENGKLREHRGLICELPAAQPNLQPSENDLEPIIPGDRLTYHERQYYVDREGCDRRGNVYLVKATERKRLASGVGGA